MNRRTITIIAVIFGVVIAGMFAFAYYQSNSMNDAEQEQEMENMDEEETAYDNITRVEAKHFFIDGTHTLVGEIAMPTACDLLNADVVVAESMPEQVTVQFSVINNAESCAQVVTAQRFRVDFDASEEANIAATFMDRDIELNLIPPAEGETPDDFELYIKG